MITYKKVANASPSEIRACKSLIDANFAQNRFDDYTHIITFMNNYDIIGFVGIYDNLLNQLCVTKEHRNKGIATQMLNVSKQMLPSPFYLYIDKNKENTEYLLNFYKSNSFKVLSENDVEYKMVFDNRVGIRSTCLFIYEYFLNIYRKIFTKTANMYFSQHTKSP